MKDTNKIILTDCDGVLLSWISGFTEYMKSMGYTARESDSYYMEKRYGIPYDIMRPIIENYNRSAVMGFLPPLRDSVKYIKKLHEEHGYVFHVITSMSSDRYAQELRKMNLINLFGKIVFDRFVFLGMGEDKTEALSEYKDSGLIWVEDKLANAKVGEKLGLESILLSHPYNENNVGIPRFDTWKEIYEYIV